LPLQRSSKIQHLSTASSTIFSRVYWCLSPLLDNISAKLEPLISIDEQNQVFSYKATDPQIIDKFDHNKMYSILEARF
jgi:hypothetical protein